MIIVKLMNTAIKYANLHNPNRTDDSTIPLFSNFDILQYLGGIFIRHNTDPSPLNSLIKKTAQRIKPLTVIDWTNKMTKAWRNMVDLSERNLAKYKYTEYRENSTSFNIFDSLQPKQTNPISNPTKKLLYGKRFSKNNFSKSFIQNKTSPFKKRNHHLKKRRRNWFGTQPPTKKVRFDHNSNKQCYRCGRTNHTFKDCFAEKDIHNNKLNPATGKPKPQKHNKHNIAQQNHVYQPTFRSQVSNHIQQEQHHAYPMQKVNNNPNIINVPHPNILNVPQPQQQNPTVAQPTSTPNSESMHEHEHNLFTFVQNTKNPNLANLYKQRQTLNESIQRLINKYPRH